MLTPIQMKLELPVSTSPLTPLHCDYTIFRHFLTLSSACKPCPSSEYAYPGSASCTPRQPCTESDYYFRFTPCEAPGVRSKIYEFLQPVICDYEHFTLPPNEHGLECGKFSFWNYFSTKLNHTAALWVNAQIVVRVKLMMMKQLYFMFFYFILLKNISERCNPGTVRSLTDYKCHFCDPGTAGNGDHCSPCGAGHAAVPGLFMTRWDVMPENLITGCYGDCGSS